MMIEDDERMSVVIEDDVRMSVDEAARFLRVCPRTLRDAIDRGEIPAARIGRRIILSKTVLQRALGLTPNATGDTPHDPLQAA